MSSLRYLARRLQVSHTTVSAVLRGLPNVKGSTREYVLCQLKAQGPDILPTKPLIRHGTIAILHVKTGTSRRRAAVARHRVIIGAAKETAHQMGYDTDQLSLGLDELPRLADILRQCSCRGLLVLPGPDADTLRRICPPFFACIYTDIAPAPLIADSVCPDYQQCVFSGISRLCAVGIRKPGLILDSDLSLPAREHLIHSYGLQLSAAAVLVAPPFFTPTRSTYYFHDWLRKNTFDGLLTTDLQYVLSLAPESALPVFNLDLNLPAVGRTAVEKIHRHQTGTMHGAPASRTAAIASWTASNKLPLSASASQTFAHLTT